MIETLKNIKRRIFRNYIFSGSRFIKGFSRNLTIEKEFLEKLDLKDKTVYDIGCAAGIFTMFFSRSVGKKGRVIAFEPLLANYKNAYENFLINKLLNIDIYNIGLGSIKEVRTMAIRSKESATASMDKDTYEMITSEDKSTILSVEIDTLDNVIESKKLPMADFIKIDVEGMEIDVLKGMQNIIERSKPKLSIENHGVNDNKKIDNIKIIVKFLLKRNYRVLHIETKTEITDKNYSIAKEGHIYCE